MYLWTKKNWLNSGSHPLLDREDSKAENFNFTAQFVHLCIWTHPHRIKQIVQIVCYTSVEWWTKCLSVCFCLSVCPSDKRINCDKTKETSAAILIPYERPIHLVFWQEKWSMRDDPLYLKFWANLFLFLWKHRF